MRYLGQEIGSTTAQCIHSLICVDLLTTFFARADPQFEQLFSLAFVVDDNGDDDDAGDDANRSHLTEWQSHCKSRYGLVSVI